ncbi:MAG TPA: T9SS type A sorting domain-containing protein [Ignavibacteria bacterium]
MKKLFLLLAIFTLITLNISNAQWAQTNGVLGYVTSLAVNGNNIFAGTSSGVYLSTNNGTTWNTTSLIYVYVYSIVINGSNIFAGTQNNSIYLSTNNGSTWNALSGGPSDVRSFLINGSNIFAGTNNSGVYLSTNNGMNWNALAGSPNGVMCFSIDGSNIFAAAGGVCLSTNNGVNWNYLPGSPSAFGLAINGTYIFANTNGMTSEVYLSTNNGVNWWQTASLGLYVAVPIITFSGNNLFAGTSNGVYLTQNYGLSWIEKNQGFGTIPFVSSLLVANNYIFAGTNNQSVWRRNLTEIIGIQNISTEIPKSFKLEQNYPNPFNPTTKIKFDIPKVSNIKLTIYDIIGKEISILVNEKVSPGSYEVEFNGEKYSSGIYFYRLETPDFVQTNKIILLK